MNLQEKNSGMLKRDFDVAMSREKFVPLLLIPYHIGASRVLQHLAFNEGESILLDARHHGDIVYCTLYFNWRPHDENVLSEGGALRQMADRLTGEWVPTGEGKAVAGRLETERLCEDLKLLREHGVFLFSWIRSPQLLLKTADDPAGKHAGIGVAPGVRECQLERIPPELRARMALTVH